MAERIRVRGQVQGVGFRPFVWRLARELGVTGTVCNDAEGVLIEAFGPPSLLDDFARELTIQKPPLSRIDALEREPSDTHKIAGSFDIIETSAGAARTRVTPDARICDDCLAEILDPEERRFGYPFANCTHCGPRFTIVESVPYDRASTVMRHFPMCSDCQSEYENPEDRRFHAQPIACPKCGPRVWLEVDGQEIEGDAIELAAERLLAGEILALKALGGFHLACDATNETAVVELRRRKRRPTKPFALMAEDVATIEKYSTVSAPENDLLKSPAAPIVLLETNGEKLAPSVAPAQWALGWMLPATPLQVLLMRAVGRPLVMTSGNLSGEPQVIGNEEARQKLTAFVDALLMSNRDIARRLDDSVAMVLVTPRIMRRARGYTPGTLPMPRGLEHAPPVAAYGAQLKSAICLTRDGQAMLSHHLGDLDDALTAEEFIKADRDYAELFDHLPSVIACDLHPEYRSSIHAESRAGIGDLPLVHVQHHHAHVAACMAENGWGLQDGPVLGVALDGLGLGADGTVWGGELLLCDYLRFERVGWLKPVPLPGGDAAQREPWRNLMAQLDAAGLTGEADRLLAGHPLPTLRAAIVKGLNAPLTSSAGRMFDAVAAAAGLAPERQSYEGEAAMNLEAAARQHLDATPYRFEGDEILDASPMWAEVLTDLAAGTAHGLVGARFHIGLADAVTQAAKRHARVTGARAIALTGGVMQNRTLLELCLERLRDFHVLTHAETPPNDGSIALGQAVVTAARHVEGG